MAAVDVNAQVDTSTVFSVGGSESVRGAASADGTGFWIGGSVGLKYVARGAQLVPATVQSSATSISLRDVDVGPDGFVYGAVATSPYGIFRTPASTTASNAALITSVMPGSEVMNTYTTAFHFDDTGLVLYVTAYYSTTYGAVSKLTFNAATGSWTTAWTKASADAFVYTAPGGSPVTPYGIHALTGSRRSDGKYILYLVTYHSTSCTTTVSYCGVLLSWDATTMPATATLVMSPPTVNYALAAVAWAPFIPSPTRTPSATRSGTSSATPSNTATGTATTTEGASPSGTATTTRTATGTPSNSPTGSVSATPPATASPTFTPTSTPSAYPSVDGAAFVPGNFAVLRVGNPADSTLGITGTLGVVQEINPRTGAIVSGSSTRHHQRAFFSFMSRMLRPSPI